MELLFEILHYRIHRLFLSASDSPALFVLGSSYMRHHDRSATAFNDVIQRPYGSVDPERVPYLSLFHNVVVEADEYYFAV
jgi:hypothetical protein